jgi:hypothetical protein
MNTRFRWVQIDQARGDLEFIKGPTRVPAHLDLLTDTNETDPYPLLPRVQISGASSPSSGRWARHHGGARAPTAKE